MAVPDGLVVAESVPQVAPLHPTPESVHFTPRFCASLVTTAVAGNCCVICTEALPGVTPMEIAGPGVIVICAVAILFGSAAAIARTVTTAGVGTENGAVYVPLLIVPTVAFPPTTPLTCQITLALELFFTVAMNCAVPAVCTEVLVMFSVMLTLALGPLGAEPNGELAQPASSTAKISANAVRRATFEGASIGMDLVPRLGGGRNLPSRADATCRTKLVAGEV